MSMIKIRYNILFLIIINLFITSPINTINANSTKRLASYKEIEFKIINDLYKIIDIIYNKADLDSLFFNNIDLKNALIINYIQNYSDFEKDLKRLNNIQISSSELRQNNDKNNLLKFEEIKAYTNDFYNLLLNKDSEVLFQELINYYNDLTADEVKTSSISNSNIGNPMNLKTDSQNTNTPMSLSTVLSPAIANKTVIGLPSLQSPTETNAKDLKEQSTDEIIDLDLLLNNIFTIYEIPFLKENNYNYTNHKLEESENNPVLYINFFIYLKNINNIIKNIFSNLFFIDSNHLNNFQQQLTDINLNEFFQINKSIYFNLIFGYNKNNIFSFKNQKERMGIKNFPYLFFNFLYAVDNTSLLGLSLGLENSYLDQLAFNDLKLKNININILYFSIFFKKELKFIDLNLFISCLKNIKINFKNKDNKYKILNYDFTLASEHVLYTRIILQFAKTISLNYSKNHSILKYFYLKPVFNFALTSNSYNVVLLDIKDYSLYNNYFSYDIFLELFFQYDFLQKQKVRLKLFVNIELNNNLQYNYYNNINFINTNLFDSIKLMQKEEMRTINNTYFNIGLKINVFKTISLKCEYKLNMKNKNIYIFNTNFSYLF